MTRGVEFGLVSLTIVIIGYLEHECRVVSVKG